MHAQVLKQLIEHQSEANHHQTAEWITPLAGQRVPIFMDERNVVQAVVTTAIHASIECGCNQLTCPMCGFAKYHARVTRIERRNPPYPDSTGYLTGGQP